ncbi:MAG: TraR/DksA C4-type zinc finger protein [Lapillicoccus sp.]
MTGSDDPAREVPAALAQELSQVRARMRAMTADMEALVAASQDSNADDEHDPEGPTIAYERSQLASLLDQGRAHLQQVESAVARVVEGTYGTCVVCGEPIPADRLEARPSARTCVRHAVT